MRLLEQELGLRANFRVRVSLWPLGLELRDVTLRSSDDGPPALVAPRLSRTGNTSAYFTRAMVRELPGLAPCVISTPVLSELGVVEPEPFRRSLERYCRAPDAEVGAALFATLQTELWLQARSS
jgi:hypothetical protein